MSSRLRIFPQVLVAFILSVGFIVAMPSPSDAVSHDHVYSYGYDFGTTCTSACLRSFSIPTGFNTLTYNAMYVHSMVPRGSPSADGCNRITSFSETTAPPISGEWYMEGRFWQDGLGFPYPCKIRVVGGNGT